MSIEELTPLERGIARGARYTRRRVRVDAHPQALAVQHEIGTRFGIPDLCCSLEEFDARLDAVDVHPNQRDEALLLRRLIDPSASTPIELIDTMEPTDEMLFRGMYYDLRPEEEPLRKLLASQADEGGYPLTHTLLALCWKGKVSEPWPDHDELVRDLAQRALDEGRSVVAPVLEANWAPYDTYAEAVALTGFAGLHDLLIDDDIDWILSQQQGDGGWHHWHPTIISLWALLEARFQLPAPGREPTTSA